jgi:hypothetical protein
VPARAIIARHKGMTRYYRSYVASMLPLDMAVYAGIWLRCGLMLAGSWLKRRFKKEKRAS